MPPPPFVPMLCVGTNAFQAAQSVARGLNMTFRRISITQPREVQGTTQGVFEVQLSMGSAMHLGSHF